MVTATTTTVKYVRPWLYKAQERAIFCPERYAVIEASTKSGKTVGSIVWLLEQAMRGKAGQNYWWVAPVYPQSRIAFTRVKAALPRGLYSANESDLRITLGNGTIIWFKTAEKPDNLYGEDVYACVIDEATRCREEAWHAVRSTLTATRGPVRIIGNVKGRRNWAYHLARKAESGEDGWHYARITATDAVAAGVLAEGEIREAQRDLPGDVFRQLYMAEPANDEGNPFGIDAIRACIVPLATTAPQVFGWDLAKSVDWTWGVALDMAGQPVRSVRFQAPWEVTVERIVSETGSTSALVDSTGVGDPVLEALQRRSPGVFEGYKFSSPSKQQLMEGLAVAIQRREIGVPAGPLVNELEAFEYEYSRTGVRYSAPVGMHDDGVVALALANHHLTHSPSQGFF